MLKFDQIYDSENRENVKVNSKNINGVSLGIKMWSK